MQAITRNILLHDTVVLENFNKATAFWFFVQKIASFKRCMAM